MTVNHPANDEPWPKANLREGTYEIQVWSKRFSPKFGWQCYYGAYMFRGERLPKVLKFIRETQFFSRDLNAADHSEFRIKNIRTGQTMPFSVLFHGDPDWIECQPR